MTTCLSDRVVVDFVDGALAGEALRDAEAHLVGCDECRMLISELARGAGAPSDVAAAHAVTEPVGFDGALSGPRSSSRPEPLPAFAVEIGSRIAGKYVVEERLGEGGMGIVVAARHDVLGERVAIKLPLGDLRCNAEARARFVREARAAAKLRGEHVARVLDAGVLEDGSPFIVMEYLSGRNLAERLRDEGRFPVSYAVDCVVQACEAIAEAHAHGIVHRDLKPANLFESKRFDETTVLKVLDFGIAKTPRLAEGDPSTTAGAILGSPRYMSPEQMRGARAIDERADIWSLGVTLYELLTGKPVFSGETIIELCTSIVTQDPPNLREARPEVPVALERVVRRCIRREPELRFRSVVELAVALGPFGGPTARATCARLAAVKGVAATEPSTLGRRLKIIGPIGACALLLGLVGAWIVTRGPATSAAPTNVQPAEASAPEARPAAAAPSPEGHEEAHAAPEPQASASARAAAAAAKRAVRTPVSAKAPRPGTSSTSSSDPHGLSDRK